MEIAALVKSIQEATALMRENADELAAEKLKYGEATAETKERDEKLNARLDELDTKLQRMAIPTAIEKVDGGLTPEAKARKDAFYKFVRGGVSNLEPDERKALVEDTTGQYLVEPDLDAEIVRTLPKITVMRDLAAIRTTTKDRLKMKSLTEVAVGWGKLETGSDITETGMTPGVPTYQYVEDLYALAKIGEDELEDADIDLEALLADSFSRAIAEAEDLAFFRGTGHDSQQPEGITINSTLVAATQTTAAAGAVIVEEFLDMIYAVASQHRKNGQFVMNSTLELAIRKLRAVDGAGTNFGEFLWQPSVQAGKPNTFLGYGIKTQDDILDLSGTTSCIAIFGDFKAGYRILDRSGMTLQRLTELYSEAGLIGFKIKKRTGGSAMRMANLPISLLTEHA